MSDRQFHYLDENRQQQGPVGEDELAALAGEGRLSRDTLVWTPEWVDWQPASSVEGLFEPEGVSAVAGAAASVGAASTQEAIAQAAVRQPASASVWGGPALPDPGYTAGTFKSLYGWWIVTFVIAAAGMTLALVLFMLGAIAEGNGNRRESEQMYIMGAIAFLPTMLVGIIGYVLWAVMVYKWWRQLQDGQATTSAGKATGFQFIPFFNLYWWFVMIWKLPENQAAFAARHGIQIRPASSGLAMTTCVLFVTSNVIGYCAGAFGLPLSVAFWVVLIISAWQISRASKDIASRAGSMTCYRCGYDLRQATTDRCPECGTPIGQGAPAFG